MIQISREELLDSLKHGYIEYQEGVANDEDVVDLAHVKGFCTTLEQILSVYGNVSNEELLEIKRPIIGEVSLRRNKKKKGSSTEVDYTVPTIFRRTQKNIN